MLIVSHMNNTEKAPKKGYKSASYEQKKNQKKSLYGVMRQEKNKRRNRNEKKKQKKLLHWGGWRNL